MLSPYMKPLVGIILTLTLCSQTVLATGNQFKFRYTGGTTETKVKPNDWKNTMTVTSDQILLELKDGQKITIDPTKVNRVTYGQNARRMVGTMIALSLINPLALFGLFHKKRSHFVGIEYSTAEGKNGAVLVQADKDQYRAMLTALSGVSGKSVETITDKDEKKK